VSARRRPRPDWQRDEVLDRMRARLRVAAVVGLLARLGAVTLSETLAASLRPLIAAVEQLRRCSATDRTHGVPLLSRLRAALFCLRC
jgi:hypothetical protein